MAYVKIIYQNSPSTATPINAQNLNHMDDGIAENDRRLNELETAGVVNKFNNRTGNVTPEKNDYDISLIGATDGQDGYVPVWRNSGTEQEPNWGFEMEQQGGSGHKILDADGSEMPQEDSLQFADSFVSDDDVNGKTVVENIKEHDTKADYDQATEDGFHVIDDGEDAVIHPSSDDYVEVDTDGIKTFAELLNDLYAKLDLTKLSEASFLKRTNSGIICCLTNIGSNYVQFGMSDDSSSESRIVGFNVASQVSDCSFVIYAITPPSSIAKSDSSSVAPAAGNKIRIYYGNKKAVVDLQTKANRCLMSDGVTSVESALTTKNIISDYSVTGLTSLLQMGNLIQASIEVTPSTIIHGTMIISKLPKTRTPLYMSFGMANGQTLPAYLGNNGDHAELIMYYPSGQTPARIDATFTYLTA